MTGRLLTVDDVAEYLGKPKGWVYANWKPRGIPFRKVGQALRCRPAALEEWVDDQN
ncbi:helix-turn-helix domain-containing protein [Streptomyces clavuligerus]|uniref:helix-turn-helix domain-containing protein n=1 Tax=Streptomyces clavuligerus TaxID=1901 RepID=UPI0001851717|nr:helix-turn-helix domain-containing protein [Streptomyces clavuligerus]WDN52211.1 helix-turn-helix domain-containing protein [Streptomyces clavuligerus]